MPERAIWFIRVVLADLDKGLKYNPPAMAKTDIYILEIVMPDVKFDTFYRYDDLTRIRSLENLPGRTALTGPPRPQAEMPPRSLAPSMPPAVYYECG